MCKGCELKFISIHRRGANHGRAHVHLPAVRVLLSGLEPMRWSPALRSLLIWSSLLLRGLPLPLQGPHTALQGERGQGSGCRVNVDFPLASGFGWKNTWWSFARALAKPCDGKSTWLGSQHKGLCGWLPWVCGCERACVRTCVCVCVCVCVWSAHIRSQAH